MDRHKAPTAKQMEARFRNEKIRDLRMIYAKAFSCTTGIQRATIQVCVDRELMLLGAQSERERREEDSRPDGYYRGFGKRRKFVPYKAAPASP